jgi:hypothetical protein
MRLAARLRVYDPSILINLHCTGLFVEINCVVHVISNNSSFGWWPVLICFERKTLLSGCW